MKKTGILMGVIMLFAISVKSQEVIKLDRNQAGRLSRLAFQCIHTEYANHLQHSMQSDKDMGTPSQLHPVFYGCYDWHSSVHGHWLLVKLLKEFPDLPGKDSIENAIDMTLTPENIAAEVAYFNAPGRISYERPYGWSWLLKLTAELATWDHPMGEKWFAGFLPVIPASLQHPAVVADRADPTGVHLDGLNLSRAWCMSEIAKALPPGSPMAKELQVIGTEHARDALPHVITENYLGTHWLATFAVYMYYSK